MLQKLVEITSEHPELLSSLVKAKQVPPYTILEREGRFYLSFFDLNILLSTEKAEQSADVLLSNINAILKLPPFRVSCALKRTGEVITVDDNDREVTKKERSIPTSAALSRDLSIIDFSNFMTMQAASSKLSRIKQALRYYSEELSWFNLYDVYECIRKDIEEQDGQEIPEHWFRQSHGMNRLDDFKESANNYNISGYIARHSEAESKGIECINDKRVRLEKNGKEITTMTLDEAREFIENLLIQWLKYRGIRF